MFNYRKILYNILFFFLFTCTTILFIYIALDKEHFIDTFSEKEISNKLKILFENLPQTDEETYKQKSPKFLNEVFFKLLFEKNKEIRERNKMLFLWLSDTDYNLKTKNNFPIKVINTKKTLKEALALKDNSILHDIYHISYNEKLSKREYTNSLKEYCNSPDSKFVFSQKSDTSSPLWIVNFYPIIYIDYHASKKFSQYLIGSSKLKLENINVAMNVKTLCFDTPKEEVTQRSSNFFFECYLNDNVEEKLETNEINFKKDDFFRCKESKSEKKCVNVKDNHMNGKEIYENFDSIVYGTPKKNYLYPLNSNGSTSITCYTRSPRRPEKIVFVLIDKNKNLGPIEFWLEWQIVNKKNTFK